MKILLGTILLLLIAGCGSGGPSSTPIALQSLIEEGQSDDLTRDVYLFAYFVDEGEDGLFLATSTDGFNWSPVNGGEAIFSPKLGPEGLFRDPFILRDNEGIFHLVWTLGWNVCGIGYARSDDLIHWSRAKILPVMEGQGATNCWAPEIFYDAAEDNFLIYWASTVRGRFPETDIQEGWNHRIYSARTRDFESLSESELFFDPGFNVIDATLFMNGNKIYMAFKDETERPFISNKRIMLASSDSLREPFEIQGEIPDYRAEGPSVMNINGAWFLYFDIFEENTMGLMVSSDLQNWINETFLLHLPPGVRHGTIFKLQEKIPRHR